MRFILSVISLCACLFTNAQLFGPRMTISLSSSGPQDVHSADLDGDGDKDVLSAGSNIEWYKNLGSGLFGPRRIITTQVSNVHSVFAADLDLDGDMDVLSASQGGDYKIAWYENLGNGYFGVQQIIASGNQVLGPTEVYAADLDGDTDLDVLSTSYLDNKLAWYENLGNGNIGSQQIISQLTSHASSVHTADMDGDGDEDVLSSSHGNNTIAWFENFGGGQFGPLQIISDQVNSAIFVSPADMDNDGDLDVISVGGGLYSTINWHENLGDGIFGSDYNITNSIFLLTSFSSGDLDNDGDIDVVSASLLDSKIEWHENLGGGLYATEEIISTQTDDLTYVNVADLDGDGDLDVLSSFREENRVSWHENRNGVPPDCSAFDYAPIDLSKSFKPINGVVDRVQLKWYKSSSQIKYSDEDAAACDIRFWPVKLLDPVTGNPVETILNPDTVILVDRKKFFPDGFTPKSIFKWPIKFRSESSNNSNRVDPNVRYKWQVRCACEHGYSQESPWSEVKIFNTPDFDPITGTFSSFQDSEASKNLLDSGVDIELFPNPVFPDAIVRLEYPAGNVQVDVFDIRGKLIRSENQIVKGHQLQLSREGLSSGSYLLRVIHKEGSLQLPFVVE